MRGLTLRDPALVARAVSSAVWTPASLTSLLGWYDASDAATITASAGLVSAWNDKSGGGRHLAASGTARPTTGTRTVNSLNVLDFDGATDKMTATYSIRAQPITFLMVYSNDVPTGDQRLLDAGGAGTRCLYDAEHNASGQKRLVNAGSSIVGGSSTTSPEQFVALYNGASSQGWRNGTSDVTGNAGTGGLTATMHCGFDGTAGWFDGMVAELVVMGAAITSGERASWNTYCARWGL